MTESVVKVDPDANFPSRVILSKSILHLPDWQAIDLPEHERRIQESHGVRSSLLLPLLREGECIGVLALVRKTTGAFGEAEIALAKSFVDQALIAIENTRLFNETQEALGRQTATADILRVISSSPTDVQPVFTSMLENATRICDAKIGILFNYEETAPFTPRWPSRGRHSGLSRRDLYSGPIHPGAGTGLWTRGQHQTNRPRGGYPIRSCLCQSRTLVRVATAELGGVRSQLKRPDVEGWRTGWRDRDLRQKARRVPPTSRLIWRYFRQAGRHRH